MRYEQPTPIELSEAETNIASGISALIADALLRASLSQIDPEWVQAASLWALSRPEFEVRWAALTALGHLVRRYRGIDIGTIRNDVSRLREDPDLSGKVQDLLDDIDVYGDDHR